jgi:hypothetical protein
MTDVMRSCHLRVAFGSDRHARYALEFLSALAEPPLTTSIEQDAELTFIELEVRSADRDRIATLMRGAHGIPIDLPTAVAEVA